MLLMFLEAGIFRGNFIYEKHFKFSKHAIMGEKQEKLDCKGVPQDEIKLGQFIDCSQWEGVIASCPFSPKFYYTLYISGTHKSGRSLSLKHFKTTFYGFLGGIIVSSIILIAEILYICLG